MSESKIPAPPIPEPPADAPRWRKALFWLVAVVIPAMLGGIGGSVCLDCAKAAAAPAAVPAPVPAPADDCPCGAQCPCPPDGCPAACEAAAVEDDTPPVVGAVDGAGGPFRDRRHFGWVKRRDVIARNTNRLLTPQFDATPAGQVSLEDTCGAGAADVYLWRFVRVAAGKPAESAWYPNIDQGNAGTCVGAGWKHGADICQAVAITQAGRPFQWKPASVEVMYGGSREIAGALGGGDGSTGAWADEWARKGGVCPMEKVRSIDLSTYIAARAQQYARQGVPTALKDAAKAHPVKATALVKTVEDVEKAIRQGYPVAVCSMQGFTMERDKDGWAKPRGQWPHCMLICGARDGGFFILNSWGDRAHTGGVYPADMPVAGFWADSRTVGRMVGEGDSFALSDIEGFPARRLDWFVFITGGTDAAAR